MTGLRIAAPPGRAGRLWLERRLQAASRGADLLDRKLRILQAELAELATVTDLARQEWRDCAAAADQVLLTASVLAGQRAVQLSAGSGYAEVSVSWTVTMGVRRPAAATCTPPDSPVPWASPPLVLARHAHEAALEAAVKYAAAARAQQVIEAETTATRVRLRAIKDRLIPGLEQARARVVLEIDELERADGARVRRAGIGAPHSR